jgi:hypothetical protein
MLRLFITHLSGHKVFAAELQNHLHSYGISSFVAHNDIEPTKVWQNEIETALSTCEALVALLHPEFHKSNWTDQEIGYAMGRGVPVYSVRFGQDPYGFIGRFQAFTGISKTSLSIATELFDTLCKGKQTQYRMADVLVDLFAGSVSFKDAKTNMCYLNNLTVWASSYPSVSGIKNLQCMSVLNIRETSRQKSKKSQLAASGEPPIHELQHLHWNCLLVKILAFEPATNRKFFGNTIDGFIFESDDNGISAVRLVPNNISDFKIRVH